MNWRQPFQTKAKTNRRQSIRLECSVRRRRINWRWSGRKASKRGANTAIVRELRKLTRVDQSIERVEARGIERVKEREQGVKLAEARAKNRRRKRNLKLNLRESVGIQAQHSLDQQHKPRTRPVSGSAKEAESRIRRRPIGEAGSV